MPELTPKMRAVLREVHRRANQAQSPANAKTIHALRRRGLVGQVDGGLLGLTPRGRLELAWQPPAVDGALRLCIDCGTHREHCRPSYGGWFLCPSCIGAERQALERFVAAVDAWVGKPGQAPARSNHALWDELLSARQELRAWSGIGHQCPKTTSVENDDDK